MEPELELPCQTVAFLQANEDIVHNKMKMMPTLNINYDVCKAENQYIMALLLSVHYYINININVALVLYLHIYSVFCCLSLVSWTAHIYFHQ